MSVGLGIVQDVERVKAVRAAIGPEIDLMIDSNHAYSLKEALEVYFGLNFFKNLYTD